MKKARLILLTILFISLYSCDKETQIDQNNFDNLKEQLKEYNNNTNASISNKDRGFWGWGGVACATVAGDVIGAAETMSAASSVATAAGVATGGTGAVVVEVVAGVVGAAGGSYVAYNAAAATTSDRKNNSTFYIADLDYPKIYKDLSNVGNMHNNLLEQSYFGERPINDWIEENYHSVNISDMNKIFSSKSWENLYSHIEQNSNNYKISDYDYHILINGSREAGYLSKDLSDFYELFFDAYTNASSFDKMIDIVKDYKEFVINSEISEKDKRTILFSLDVAAKSPVYWVNKN